MVSTERTHFDAYDEQNFIKHTILGKYLPAFYRILGTNHNNLLYIDGFAGRGHYAERYPGSPLIAMDVATSTPKLTRDMKLFFFESDAANCRTLKKAVRAHERYSDLATPPVVERLEFEDAMGELLQEASSQDFELAPAFIFVDPCRVKGAPQDVLAQLLSKPHCELFVFLNYDGLNRTLGLGADKPTVQQVFGGQEAAEAVIETINGLKGQEREAAIIEAYIDGIKERAGSKYASAFRIESRSKQRTSHYLIHFTKHKLGFKIMKDVMYDAGRDAGELRGRLEYLQASRGSSGLLFGDPIIDEIESNILDQLMDQDNLQVRDIVELALRPADSTAPKCYKEVLKLMEQDGRITVLDKKGQSPAPASSRKKGTLGDDYYLTT